MRQYTAQRPRDTGEIQRLHEQGRVSNLPAAEGAHEPPELFLAGPPEPRGLLLEGAERSELTLRLDEPFHGPGTEGADELVLQVHDAHEETKSFHVVPSQVGTVPRPLEAAPEVAFLGGVAQAGQPEVEPLRAEPIQEAADVLRSTHRHDGDAFAVEGPTPPLCRSSTHARPPCISAKRATTDKPIPRPEVSRRASRPCRKGSNTARRIPAGTPGPSSSTAIRMPSSFRRTATHTGVPGGVCFPAFTSRFSTI